MRPFVCVCVCVPVQSSWTAPTASDEPIERERAQKIALLFCHLVLFNYCAQRALFSLFSIVFLLLFTSHILSLQTSRRKSSGDIAGLSIADFPNESEALYSARYRQPSARAKDGVTDFVCVSIEAARSGSERVPIAHNKGNGTQKRAT